MDRSGVSELPAAHETTDAERLKYKGGVMLTKHFSYNEVKAGNSDVGILIFGWKPDWILRQLVVAEIARELWASKTGLIGIKISSGFRPGDNKRHGIGLALDLRPLGDWTPGFEDYEPFYSCVIRAAKHVSNATYGIGYYQNSHAGIHVDADVPDAVVVSGSHLRLKDIGTLRANQNRSIASTGIKGYRWCQPDLSWNASILLPLFEKYEKNYVPELGVKTWQEWYEQFKPEPSISAIPNT